MVNSNQLYTMCKVVFFLMSFIVGSAIYAQKTTKNYIAFDQISLYDITVGIDSTRVIEYEYDEYVFHKNRLSYPNLQSFKEDQHIDEDVIFMNTDSISSEFRLELGDTFILNSNPEVVLEVVPNNIIKSHFKLDAEVPDLIKGCSLRFKRFKTENYSVYLILHCEGGLASLLFQNNEKQLYADVQELLGEYDFPRIQKVFLRDIPSNYPDRLICFIGGLEVFEVENKKGIKDFITNTIFLPAEYDDIELKGVIIVKKDAHYGAYDYELNTILEIENKIVTSRSSFKPNMTFIDATNQIGTINIFGNKHYKDQLIKGKNFKKTYDYKIELKENVFYLRKKTRESFKNQYLTVIGTTDLYTNVFFDSKNADFYFDIPNFLFASRIDGGYDIFSFIEYNHPVGTQLHNLNEIIYQNERVQDYKLVMKYPFWSPYSARPIVKINDKEHPILDKKIPKNRYISIDVYFKGYYYFTLPNGRKGWVDLEGKEYFDDE